jgi:hypothetical protein
MQMRGFAESTSKRGEEGGGKGEEGAGASKHRLKRGGLKGEGGFRRRHAQIRLDQTGGGVGSTG